MGKQKIINRDNRNLNEKSKYESIETIDDCQHSHYGEEDNTKREEVEKLHCYHIYVCC